MPGINDTIKRRLTCAHAGARLSKTAEPALYTTAVQADDACQREHGDQQRLIDVEVFAGRPRTKFA